MPGNTEYWTNPSLKVALFSRILHVRRTRQVTLPQSIFLQGSSFLKKHKGTVPRFFVGKKFLCLIFSNFLKEFPKSARLRMLSQLLPNNPARKNFSKGSLLETASIFPLKLSGKSISESYLWVSVTFEFSKISHNTFLRQALLGP